MFDVLDRVRIEREILRGLDAIKLIVYAIIIAMLMAVAAPVLFLIVRSAR